MRIIKNVLLYCSIIFSLFGCVLVVEEAYSGGEEYLYPAEDPGMYTSPNGRCRALLEVSSMGGFKSLRIDSASNAHSNQVINDVTGVLWTKENKLIYSVSPIYGRPGIYTFDCTHAWIKRIVPPITITKAYPDGADDFELKSYLSFAKKIFFYYTPDVDKVDFNRFRTDEFLFQVNIDGSEFGPAIEKKNLEKKK